MEPVIDQFTAVADPLLSSEDGAPFEVYNQDGAGDVVLVCEHASQRVPGKLGNLGLTAEQLNSHIGWDPGALDLGKLLSGSLDAPFVAARFSRLVIDCNRPPEAQSAMPVETEVCRVPGNERLSVVQRQQRAQEIYEPFHAVLAQLIATKRLSGRNPVLVAIHSFTPVFHGERRAVEIGYLHGEDDRLARAMMHHSSGAPIADIRLNEPYGPSDGVLHTINFHLENCPMLNVMVEVRNDLLNSPAAIGNIHGQLLNAIKAGLSELSDQTKLELLGIRNGQQNEI